MRIEFVYTDVRALIAERKKEHPDQVFEGPPDIYFDRKLANEMSGSAYREWYTIDAPMPDDVNAGLSWALCRSGEVVNCPMFQYTLPDSASLTDLAVAGMSLGLRAAAKFPGQRIELARFFVSDVRELGNNEIPDTRFVFCLGIALAAAF